MSNITVNVSSSGPVIIKIPLPVRFWLMLIVEIPSLFCTLFLLYHLIFDRVLRLALNNHVTIVVLILTLLYELINIPANLNYYRTGTIWPPLPGICLTIWMMGFGGYNTCEILVAWASFERHILIFYHQWMNSRIKRICLHYLPLASILIYSIIFYTKVILFPDCQNHFYYNAISCGAFACYQADPFLAMWDVLFNSAIPTLLIAFFSLTLLIRVIIQKGSLGRQHEWRRYRKMITQLLSLATLHFLFNFPTMLLFFVQLTSDPHWGNNIGNVFYFSTYFLLLLQPFCVLNAVPNVGKKFIKLIPKLRTATVVPLVTTKTKRNALNA